MQLVKSRKESRWKRRGWSGEGVEAAMWFGLVGTASILCRGGKREIRLVIFRSLYLEFGLELYLFIYSVSRRDTETYCKTTYVGQPSVYIVVVVQGAGLILVRRQMLTTAVYIPSRYQSRNNNFDNYYHINSSLYLFSISISISISTIIKLNMFLPVLWYVIRVWVGFMFVCF